MKALCLINEGSHMKRILAFSFFYPQDLPLGVLRMTLLQQRPRNAESHKMRLQS